MDKQSLIWAKIIGIFFIFLGLSFVPWDLIRGNFAEFIFGERFSKFVAGLVLPALMIGEAIGLLLSKEWARKIILFAAVPLFYAAVLFFCYSYAAGEGTYGWAGLIWFGYTLLLTAPFAAVLVISLTQPGVKESFQGRASSGGRIRGAVSWLDALISRIIPVKASLVRNALLVLVILGAAVWALNRVHRLDPKGWPLDLIIGLGIVFMVFFLISYSLETGRFRKVMFDQNGRFKKAALRHVAIPGGIILMGIILIIMPKWGDPGITMGKIGMGLVICGLPFYVVVTGIIWAIKKSIKR